MATPQPHEAKGMPILVQEEKVVEAFGALKCPKLIAQISQENNTVLRNNALKVLCEELRNPYSASGVTNVGAVPVLTSLTTKSEDKNTRENASKALAAIAVDSNGRASMIKEDAPGQVLSAISDSSPVVRSNVYEALQSLSCVRAGVSALVAAGYAPALVAKAKSEADDVRHQPLQLLLACIKNDEGLTQALDSEAVSACIGNLEHKSTLVRTAAAGCLGYLAFADSAKIAAIQEDAVPLLGSMLEDSFWKVRAAAAGALMSIIQTDAGKKALVPAGAVPKLIKLLKDPNDLVKINVLKTIACAAVHPDARKEMRESSDCLPVVHQIMDAGDELLSKHAKIAREAVLWQP
ncbi:hypothetical protein TeGR_g5309 [Tetraparma gracilis]|uniref:Radial spoke protein 8 n=1 Tax=Tetraparma gracilis TaxID=2962635 RepID=A0ABQ6M7V9_9STRA|nr:hypothetical protein TeGR_g5309 [Tetraparma gracilis]